MEKAKDGVTLIADAIRAEMAQAEKEKAKTTTTTNNVIDVTAQFAQGKQAQPATPPVKAETPPTPAEDNTPPTNDGTVFENDKQKGNFNYGNYYNFFKEKKN